MIVSVVVKGIKGQTDIHIKSKLGPETYASSFNLNLMQENERSGFIRIGNHVFNISKIIMIRVSEE